MTHTYTHTQVIVTALIMGLSSIGYIAVILVLFYYVFAILGMILFGASGDNE